MIKELKRLETKFESNPEKLAEEVLAEIPKQILEYYEQNEIDVNKYMIQ